MEEHHLTNPTPFEIETALSFLYFQKQKCDLVVLETGLGGALDATNIIKTPVMEVIAPISMDHMAFLGDTPGGDRSAEGRDHQAAYKGGIRPSGKPEPGKFWKKRRRNRELPWNSWIWKR